MRRGDGRLRAASSGLDALTAEDEPEEAARDDRADLADAAGREGDQDEGEDRDRRARAIGRRLWAMPSTACATTATATSLRPCSSPRLRALKRARAIRDERHGDRRRQGEAGPGRQRAGIAARMRPMANPTWLLAGPGRNWQSATRSPRRARRASCARTRMRCGNSPDARPARRNWSGRASGRRAGLRTGTRRSCVTRSQVRARHRATDGASQTPLPGAIGSKPRRSAFAGDRFAQTADIAPP